MSIYRAKKRRVPIFGIYLHVENYGNAESIFALAEETRENGEQRLILRRCATMGYDIDDP